MTATFSAIPTLYAGVQFRSRLEARWAAFFDILGWKWEYEPVDLEGYIPDFVLDLKRPVLVEVKPILTWPCPVVDCRDPHCRKDTDVNLACTKILNSSWQDEAIIVGAKLEKDRLSGFPLMLGWLVIEQSRAETEQSKAEGPNLWGQPAVFMRCTECGVSLCSQWSWNCRVCGANDGDRFIHDQTHDGLDRRILPMWRNAGNRVQWNPPR